MRSRIKLNTQGFGIVQALVIVGALMISLLALFTSIDSINRSVRLIQLKQATLQDQILLTMILGNKNSCKAAFAGMAYGGTQVSINSDLKVQGEIILNNPSANLRRPDGLVVTSAVLSPVAGPAPIPDFYSVRLIVTYDRGIGSQSDLYAAPGIALTLKTVGGNIVSCQALSPQFGGLFTVHAQCDNGNFPPTGCPASWFTQPTMSACRFPNLYTGDCFCPAGFTTQVQHDWSEPCWADGTATPFYPVTTPFFKQKYHDNLAPWPPQPASGSGSPGSNASTSAQCGIKQYQCLAP